MVRTRLEEARLILEVTDNGSGYQALERGEWGGDGIGLTTTRQRLNQLYGERHNLDFLSAKNDGLLVRISIPLT